jgi:hypothetical protein
MIFVLRTFFVLTFFACFSSAIVLHAEDLQPDEQKIKPAIVFNIARYVTWPVSVLNDSTDFTIGIYGHGRTALSWGTLHGKVLHGHKVTVRRTSDPEELQNCHIVFIESTERKNVPRILAVLKEFPVLTVSDIDGFSHSGGIITLRTVNNLMKFEVNLKSARTSGLSISSNILKLAIEVIQ